MLVCTRGVFSEHLACQVNGVKRAAPVRLSSSGMFTGLPKSSLFHVHTDCQGAHTRSWLPGLAGSSGEEKLN